MKTGRIFKSAISLLLVTLMFTGCQELKLPSERDVLEYLDELCPNEKVTYEVTEGKGIIYNEKQYIYEFSSKERDLEFEIYAMTKKESYTNFWYPAMEETYRQNIRNYYKDEILDVFNEYDDVFSDVRKEYIFKVDPYNHYEITRELPITINSFDDMEDIINATYELNVIYSAEEEFNTKEWMTNNPLFELRLNFKNTTANYYSKSYMITGDTDYEEVKDTLTRIYIQGVLDGSIVDDNEYDFTGMHKTELKVKVNGKKVDKEDINGETSVNTLNPDRFVATYDYDTDAYYLPINPRISKTANPELLEFYIDCADGDLIDHSAKETKFEIGSDEFVIEMELVNRFNNYIDSITIKKNGKKMNIDVQDKINDGQYVFYVNVDDLAEIFNFEYEINEDEGIINLQFN